MANFEDSSDDEVAENSSSRATNGLSSKSTKLTNGAGKLRKSVNGAGLGDASDAAKKARKAEAERLSVKRQELPFYQGKARRTLQMLMARTAGHP